jgi:hypothetical protein
MHALTTSLSLSRYDAACADACHELPHPPQAQVEALGYSIATEMLDVLLGTALEEHVQVLMEGLIGGVHSAILRLQRQADRSADDMRRLQRDFDGSEIKDVELQDATVAFNRAEAAVMIAEVLRDAASETYTQATGEVWTPWRGSARNQATTFAMTEARDALRARDRRDQAMADPGAQVVVFRGARQACTQIDAMRIYDALNWAHAQFPDMRLATTGNLGAEQIALKWARDKRISPILSKANFERFKSAAPFRANDELLALDPVLVLTLDVSLDPAVKQDGVFGPSEKIAIAARAKGIRVVPVTRRK